MQFFFQKNNKNNDQLFYEIEKVCNGLIYISETDAPVRAFAGQEVDLITSDFILQQTGKAGDVPVEERNFDEFFARLTANRDWHGREETERAKKFAELQKLLKENLRKLKVFTIGERRLEIFAVGISKDGCLMGIRTEAVET
ncbi:MAG: nuclease A inhibitor family protein [Pyrinomonadaceae bacterium]